MFWILYTINFWVVFPWDVQENATHFVMLCRIQTQSNALALKLCICITLNIPARLSLFTWQWHSNSSENIYSLSVRKEWVKALLVRGRYLQCKHLLESYCDCDILSGLQWWPFFDEDLLEENERGNKWFSALSLNQFGECLKVDVDWQIRFSIFLMLLI